MNFKGVYGFAKSRDDVWRAMNDPSFLKEVVPGCQRFEKMAENQYRVQSRIEYGPLKLSVKGELRVDPMTPPEYYVLHATASTWLGAVSGHTHIWLHNIDGGCAFEYKATVDMGSGLAKIGQKVMSGTVKGLSDQFFEGLAAKMDTKIIPVCSHEMAES